MKKPIPFSSRLRSLREQAGFSIYGLAQRSGVSHQQITRMESGDRTEPRLSTLQKLAAAMGLSLSAFDEPR